MSKPEVVEALDLHAEGLKEGMDLAPVLLAQATPDNQPLSGLLSLAAQVKSVLVLVEPPPGFVTDLKTRLLANAAQERKVKAIRQKEQERKVILGALAGVGGLLYAAGVALLGLRMMFAMASLLLTLLGWLMAHPLALRSRRAR